MRKQIPIMGEMVGHVQSRETAIGTYDIGTRYVNGYFEIYKGAIEDGARIEFIKRPGISTTDIQSVPAVIGTTPKPIAGLYTQYNQVLLGWTYTSALTTSIQLSLNTTVMAAPAGWSTTLPFCILTELDHRVMGYIAAVTNGTNTGLVTSTGVFSRITDADHPTIAVPSAGHTNCIYMDGYIFQGTSDGKIYNSDLNSATSYTATGFISANQYAGALHRLGRLGRYLVAFKDWSIEFLENQGNPTPGSPLGIVKNLAKPVGSLHPDLIKETTDGFIFVGRTRNGQFGVYRLKATDLTIQKVSDGFVDSLLNGSGIASSLPAYTGGSGYVSGDGLVGCFVLPWKGHEFYVLPFDTYSMVFDNSNSTWTMWSFNNNGTQDAFKSPGIITQDSQTSVGKIFILRDPNLFSTNMMPKQVLDTSYYDNGTINNSILFKWVSPRLDFGSLKRKFMSSLEVAYSAGGSHSSFPADNGTLTMSYDDGELYDPTTNRTATVTPSNDPTIGTSNRAVWRRLGSFRRRRITLSHSSNQPFKLQYIECEVSSSDEAID